MFGRVLEYSNVLGSTILGSSSHAQSESAGPNKSWGQPVATLGRPHCHMFFLTVALPKRLLTVGPPQCSYGLAPRKRWTRGFTLSVVYGGHPSAPAVHDAAIVALGRPLENWAAPTQSGGRACLPPWHSVIVPDKNTSCAPLYAARTPNVGA